MSKFKNVRGVYKRKDNGKYVANISLNGKKIYLGLFDDEEEAICTLMAVFQCIDIDYHDVRKESPFYYVTSKIQNRKDIINLSDFYRYLFCYDWDTGVLYWKNNPSFVVGGQRAGYIAYNSSDKKYKWLKINIGRSFKDVKLHRIIFQMCYGYISNDLVIDHYDKNPLNNRIDNLMEVTHKKNAENMSLPKHNKSGVMGVKEYKYVTKTSWVSYITSNGKTTNLGSYENFEEAVYARFFGEMCCGWDKGKSDTYRYIKENMCR